jgi:ADP-heptose:LPS heptosyltransferase
MQLGADLCIGARAHDAPLLDRWVAYAPPASQRLIALEVAALAGASAPFPERELAVTDEDRRLAAQLLAPRAGERLVVVQPGVTDPRRRWPTERFAAVADMLAQEGAQIVVNGTAQEAPLVRAVVGAMRQPALDATGRLSLQGLCGLFERALLVLSNDTGPLHLALAIGTPCVGIFWFTNLINGAPLQPSRLRAALSARVHCPVCGAENIRYRCPHDDSFVADVGVDEVADMALSLLHTSSAARALPAGTAAAGSRA